MTKVTIKQSKAPKGPLVHKIGNWYNTKDGSYVILANVQAKAVLIYTNGNFHVHPVEYHDFEILTQEEFDKCCGNMKGEFHLVPNITISEE